MASPTGSPDGPFAQSPEIALKMVRICTAQQNSMLMPTLPPGDLALRIDLLVACRDVDHACKLTALSLAHKVAPELLCSLDCNQSTYFNRSAVA